MRTIYPFTECAEAGGLIAYAGDLPAAMARAMEIVARVLKGANPAEIAFEKKSETDRAYYELASTMLDGAREGVCSPVFGTHDLGLIARIVARASVSGVARGDYQIHMLYGIRDAAQRRLVAEGQTVKTLISYGSAWYRWYMRRLAERPANVLFVLKSLFG